MNYGIDLITDGMSVGVILEEIDFMELEICPMASLEELRKPLATYFGKLHKNATGTNNPLDERAQGVVVSIPDREAARRRGRRTSIDGLIGRACQGVVSVRRCERAVPLSRSICPPQPHRSRSARSWRG